jgi:cytochrome P450
VIHRLVFHPLASYPGPLFSKISGIPQLLAAWGGYSHERIRALHEEYGDVVRYAPWRLSFNTVEAVRDIYEDRKANLVKTGFIDIPNALYGRGSLHSMIDREAHASLRRLISYALSDHALKDSEEFAVSRIRVFCDYIGDSQSGGWTKGQNMTDWANMLTVDILGELSFGASFGSLEAGESPIPSLLKQNFIYQHRVCRCPYVMFYITVALTNLCRIFALHEDHHSFH